jgi:N-acetylmuramic acid 6-phosphate (MurNAc-6-P) etherase
MNVLSITESPSEITAGIDLATPVEMVRQIQLCSRQIFSGWGNHAGLNSPEILLRLSECANRVAAILKQDGVVVLSGAGTSGRLAAFLAGELNAEAYRLSGKQPFRYLTAGGPSALIVAQEGAEDDPFKAVADFKDLLTGWDGPAAYIGITCGLSAPYVAGQLEYCIERDNTDAILLGFNPLEMARAHNIPRWGKSFRQVAEQVDRHERGLVLNPVLGPEPVTGSTRMKGGDATKLILEVVLHAALQLNAGRFSPETSLKQKIEKDFEDYAKCLDALSESEEPLSQMIQAAGQCLKSGGHIYYLGQGRAGLLAIIDASECPPTFGADFDDVRGFAAGGLEKLMISPRGEKVEPPYELSLKGFRRDIYSRLDSSDLVIQVGFLKDEQLLLECAEKNAKTARILFPPEEGRGNPLDILLPSLSGESGSANHWQKESALKRALNIVSTGAHILAGKVYGNRMIDLRISNEKLVHRAIELIQQLSGVSRSRAEECLAEAAGRDFRGSKLSISAEKTVPKALLLASEKLTAGQAEQELKKQPIVRALIAKHTIGGKS